MCISNCQEAFSAAVRLLGSSVVVCRECAIQLHPKAPADLNFQEIAMQGFVTKDSGERQQFETGMVRDVQTDKPRYDLVDRPMLKRWAELMGRGAVKYGEDNWRKAATEAEMKRFAASLLRHVYQLLDGDRTEDHAAAVMFNVAGYEMVRGKLGA